MKLVLPVVLGLLVSSVLMAQDGDPIDPSACTLQEIGRMDGWITQTKLAGRWQQFGSAFASVGDANQDALSDWVVSYVRCDTMLPRGGSYSMPQRLRLYYGTHDFPPDTASGQELGPLELGADVEFLAAGDFDGDSNRDIVTAVALYSDTADGWDQYTAERLVIYWGDGSGAFSNADTTQLENVRSLWLGIVSAIAEPIKGTGRDRLIVRGSSTLVNGEIVRTARLSIFSVDQDGERWGRGGVRRTAIWSWWGTPDRSVYVLGADGDSLRDLCYVTSSSPDRSAIAIAYGTPDGYFDTVGVESVSLLASNCHSTVFTDLTGDGLPEIACLCGSQDVAKVYVGKRGQRLLQQYGSGDDPPHPGSDDWWARPWATVWMPGKFDTSWPVFGFARLYSVGDIGRDRIGDLAVFGEPNLYLYNGGAKLDSLIDGVIPQPGNAGGVGRLGNIDGSEFDVIAVHHGYNPGGVIFYHPDSCVGRTFGTYVRQMPEGTGPSSVRREYTPAPALDLTVGPTPAQDRVTVTWPVCSGSVVVMLHDLVGHELQRWTVSGSAGSLPIDVGRLPRGEYLLQVVGGGRSGSAPLILQ